jgi:hypothetical protein
MISFDEMLTLTGERNKVIDVFKIDIDDGEVSFFEHLDVDYFCKYVKQFVIETHVAFNSVARRQLGKLEKCFFLFHRDTRFYMKEESGPTGWIIEFQNPKGFQLEITKFKDEMEIAEYMFNMGELYFANLNFLE